MEWSKEDVRDLDKIYTENKVVTNHPVLTQPACQIPVFATWFNPQQVAEGARGTHESVSRGKPKIFQRGCETR